MRKQTVAVVGAGPAGLAAATSAAERGFAVTLFEKSSSLGGQFRLAMAVPGKEEFAETLRYFTRRLEVLGVDVRLGALAAPDDLIGFDQVIVATGVVPRMPEIPGIDHPSVASYADVLSGAVVPGRRVAVIGAGGIGVDVSVFLTHEPEDLDDWMAHWGVGDPALTAGGLTEAKPRTPVREVTLVQRKTTPIGIGLGKTSGWAHRAVLKQSKVTQVSGATYDRIDDDGLHVTVDGVARVIEADTVVVCAGQDSVRGLYDGLLPRGPPDRRRRRCGGARREARDQAGDRGRGGVVGSSSPRMGQSQPESSVPRSSFGPAPTSSSPPPVTRHPSPTRLNASTPPIVRPAGGQNFAALVCQPVDHSARQHQCSADRRGCYLTAAETPGSGSRVDHLGTHDARVSPALRKPHASSADAAPWQRPVVGRLDVELEHLVDEAAGISDPVPTRSLRARLGEAEPGLRCPPLLGDRHPVRVDLDRPAQVADRPVRADDADEVCPLTAAAARTGRRLLHGLERLVEVEFADVDPEAPDLPVTPREPTVATSER